MFQEVFQLTEINISIYSIEDFSTFFSSIFDISPAFDEEGIYITIGSIKLRPNLLNRKIKTTSPIIRFSMSPSEMENIKLKVEFFNFRHQDIISKSIISGSRLSIITNIGFSVDLISQEEASKSIIA